MRLAVDYSIAAGTHLDAPLKGMGGTSLEDPKIMLSTIRATPDAIMYEEEAFDILYAVVRAQAQLIRENVGNPADNFPLALEPLSWLTGRPDSCKLTSTCKSTSLSDKEVRHVLTRPTEPHDT